MQQSSTTPAEILYGETAHQTSATPLPTPSSPPPTPGAPSAARSAAEILYGGTAPQSGPTPLPNTPSTPADPAAPAASTLQLPEGTQLDAQAVKRTTTLAKELGLSPDHAQKALEFASAEVTEFKKGLEAKSETLRTQTWPDAVKADPDIGGANFQRTMQDVDAGRRAAIEAGVWDESLTAYLDQTGLGNHPAAIKLVALVGRLAQGRR